MLKSLKSLYPSPNSRVEKGLQGLYRRLPGIESAIVHVSESLSFTGVRRLYHAADVLVSPYKAEGFNLPVLEAAASGLTVIVTLGGFVAAGF